MVEVSFTVKGLLEVRRSAGACVWHSCLGQCAPRQCELVNECSLKRIVVPWLKKRYTYARHLPFNKWVLQQKNDTRIYLLRPVHSMS